MSKICAGNATNEDRTLCGDALEGSAGVIGIDEFPPPVVAWSGVFVTCPTCLNIIRCCRDGFKEYSGNRIYKK